MMDVWVKPPHDTLMVVFHYTTTLRRFAARVMPV